MSPEPTDPPRPLTKADVARIFDVSTRTVTAWVKKGCPVTIRPGRPHLFNEDELREWKRRDEESEGRAISASQDTLRRAELARKLTLARRNELELAAERGLPDLRLDEQIRAAKTHDDLMEISKEVGALLGSGALSPSRGRAIQALLAEARHNMRAHREAEGDEEPERLILLTSEGAELVRAFEGICSDERRQGILDHVHAEADVDLAQYPNVDMARAALEEEGDPGQDGGEGGEAEPTRDP